MNNRQIDHLVYVVRDLEAASDWFEQLSGVRPVFGGHHATQGTKNALVGLGGRTYLEFLAVDPDNHTIAPPRWMGIDLLTQPKLTRWALTSTDLDSNAAVVRKFDPAMGELTGGQRRTSNGRLLEWKIAMPLAAPEVELVPFFVDWSASAFHPADRLSSDCRLRRLILTHPNAEQLNEVLLELGCDPLVEKGQIVSLRAELNTPKGIVVV